MTNKSVLKYLRYLSKSIIRIPSYKYFNLISLTLIRSNRYVLDKSI